MHYILVILAIVVGVYILFKAAKIMVKVALVCIILFIAYVTNPSDEQHIKAVSEKAANDHRQIDAHDIQVQNYKVCSLTRFQGHVIGIGAFRKVWIYTL